jgi:hypothetical protein
MTHHQIIRQEVEQATKAVAEISASIEQLDAQRSRIAAFIDAMSVAMSSMPEQLEFELDSVPENVAQFDK